MRILSPATSRVSNDRLYQLANSELSDKPLISLMKINAPVLFLFNPSEILIKNSEKSFLILVINLSESYSLNFTPVPLTSNPSIYFETNLNNYSQDFFYEIA